MISWSKISTFFIDFWRFCVIMKLMYYDCNKFRLKLLKLPCHVSVFVVRRYAYFWISTLVLSITFQRVHCLF